MKAVASCVLAAWGTLAAAQLGWAQAIDEDSRPPNIIVILCDDLGYGDLECFGHPHIQTPRLNQLAESGMRLTDFYSAAPVCSPSRVGLLTGRSPNRAGVYDWIPAAADDASQRDLRDLVHMRQSEVTIPQLLKQAGYATCMSGKWHCNAKFNSDAQPQPSDAGFDHWFGTQNNASPSHENPVNYVRNGDRVGQLEGFSCQLATTEGIEWMERQLQEQADRPFFLYLAFHEPHEPVASPAELVDRYRDVARNDDEAQYFANVANIDRAVGRLMDAVYELGIDEQTLIVFSSDNGPETLDRYARANRSYGQPGPLRGMKLWTTEAGFRVPAIISWPGQIETGQVSDQVVSALDLLPTCCSLAGVTPPSALQLDGVDLKSLFAGQSLQREKPLLWCYYNAINERRVAMRHGRWKMLAKLDDGQLRKVSNVFEGNQQIVHSAELSGFELYDVVDDIGESHDLFSTEPRASELRELMNQRYQELVQDSHVWRTQ